MIENAKTYILFDNSNNVIIELYHENNCRIMEENHCHSITEIFLALSGKGQFKTAEKILGVQKGDIFIFRSMEPHQLINISEAEPIEMLTLTFSSNNFLNNNSSWIPPELVDIFYDKSPAFNNKISKDTKTAKRIKKILLDIKSEFEDVTASNNEYILKVKLLEILAVLFQYYGTYSNVKKIQSHKHLNEIENTMIYINQHLSEKLSLDQLAKIANMNTSYYCTLFKKLNHITVWDFILSERIQLAISYLHSSQKKMSILEIATRCGFNNTVNFNKCFKKITGTTPSEYRKNCSKQY